MKLKQLLLSLLALLANINALAYDAEINGIYYEFWGSQATVTYKNTIDDYPGIISNYKNDVVIPETVKYNNQTYRVTSIGRQAFFLCTGLTSVTIPNSVTSIDDNAFEGCSNLTSVIIPNSVTSIGYDAFSGCVNLASITIGSGVTSIGNDAFYVGYDSWNGNTGNKLTSIIVDAGNTTYDSRGNCNAIIETATNSLIAGCMSTIIPNDVTSIGRHAFSYCSGLSSITIPASVTSIDYSAFSYCSGLSSITIPESVTSIESGAFNNCDFARDSFINNSGLTSSDNWGANLYDVGTDDGLLINNNTVVKCRPWATSVMIPEGVTGIEYLAFQNCINLTSITIPASVTSIGSSAFYGCYFANENFINNSGLTDYYNWGATLCDEETNDGLLIKDNSVVKCRPWVTSVIIPEGVTSIGYGAFRDCSSLISVEIPTSLIKIKTYAFSGCSSLTDVWCYVEYPSQISLDSGIFNNCPISSATLHVPKDCVQTYQNAWTWKDFGTIIAAAHIIDFADANVEAICVSRWDDDNDGKLSKEEAAEVSSLYGFSYKTNITSFDELQYFTGLTSIDSNAFEGCSNLTSVTIPGSVTRIGSGAFSDCYALASINIPNSVTTIEDNAFSYCNSLASVHITDLAAWCNIPFYRETNNPLYYAHHLYLNGQEIKDLVIPESVTEIKKYAFSGCSGLTSAVIPENVTDIGIYAFHNCSGLASIIIPQDMTNINEGTFAGCSGLTAVTIPESVTGISSYAFNGCSGLTSINIPESVTGIGSYAFKDCSGLTSINIPSRMQFINEGTFSGCSGLTSFIIPSNISIIYKGAFSNCINIKNLVIEDSSSYLYCYENYRQNSDHIYSCFSACHLESVYIGRELRTSYSIEQSRYLGFFRDKSTLKSVSIGENVTYIDACMFENCTGLTSVVIPNNITSIGSDAFRGCTSLTSVSIGNGITNIYSSAFYACSNLTSVKVDANTPPSITDTYTFSNRENATLIVPAGCKAAYQAADYWKEFKRIIEDIHGDVNGDEEVDVLDVVDIVRYVVDDPADTFVPILADINNNGEVNVGDAVALVNEIAGDQNFVKPWRAPQQNSVADDVLTLTSTDNGMSLCMENERNYTAFQFDLYLPTGTDATDMLLNAQRKQGHLLVYNKVEEGHYRVAAISTSNHTFSGYEGELLAVGLEGIASEDICLRNIRFFTTDGEEHRFDDIVMQSGTATDIASPRQPSNEEAQDIYDLQGRKMVNGKWLNGKSSKGIYIVNGKKIAF